MQYTVEEAGFLRDVAPKEYAGKSYPKKIIGLKFTDGSQAEWYVDASEAIPAPGTTLNGNIQPDPKGKFADSFRQDRNGGSPQAQAPASRPQTASKGGGWSDEKDARITRLAAQKAAVEMVKTASYPSPDAQKAALQEWILYFVLDADTPKPSGQATLDDALTGDQPPF